MVESSYTSRSSGSAAFSPGVGGQPEGDYWPLEKLRKCYTDYLFSKREEIDEQIDARRYYNSVQYTADQIKVLKLRKQPIMTFNKIAEKINGYVGQIENLRQDPKAYARTPQHEQGADLATATLNYVLDQQDWNAKSPEAALTGAIDGVGGMELDLIQGDKGDAEIGLEVVDVQAFFYDPRSYKADFSDAAYMGIGKWFDVDVAKEMYPDAAEDAFSNESELHSNSDREMRWFRADGIQKRVRVVDMWYKHKGGWCYAQFSGNAILKEGKSYLQDEKGKDYCKYIMFSGNVDQDGDRYGFVRNMKSAQDGINAKQSKMQHILASKRLFIRKGIQDVEKVRIEYAKPDGVIETVGSPKEEVLADDQSFDFAGWTKMLEFNMMDLDQSGPSPQLIGEQGDAKSGRAIQLLQQAGMAKLGPYILAFKGWKVRLYRAIWNAIQRHWQGERWVRVTDDQDLAQFIQINGLGMDPQTGQPTIINALGSLDVDIILDEGPDQINSMADVYDTLQQVLPAVGPLLQPGQAQQVVALLVETSPLPADVKKRWKQQSEQAAQQPPPPDPAVEAAKMKAQIDIEKMERTSQIDAQKAQQSAQLEQSKADQDAAIREREAEAEIELMNRKAATEIEIERIKAAASIEIERMKANLNMEIRESEHAHNCEEMKAQGEHQREMESIKAKSAKSKATAD